jgi:DHA2 family multidrug resistance protein-like MFS transporter
MFIRRQGQLADPMIDLSLFQNRAFSVAFSSNVLNVFVSFGSFILISQYLQLVLGLSPIQAGLLSLPASLLAIAGPMLSAYLSERVGLRFSLAGLLGIAGLGFALQTLVGGSTAVLFVAAGWALWAFGGSAAATLSTSTIIGAARPERAGAVSALGQTGGELGGALGIAMLGSLGTLIYRAAVASALPTGISPEMASAARDTLGGALSVANQLSDAAAAATLVATAQDGLTAAVQLVCGISAVVMLLTAIAVMVYINERQPSQCRPTCEAEQSVAADRETPRRGSLTLTGIAAD